MDHGVEGLRLSWRNWCGFEARKTAHSWLFIVEWEKPHWITKSFLELVQGSTFTIDDKLLNLRVENALDGALFQAPVTLS